MTSDLLFVYGTLMRGFDHPMARLLSANADFLGEARCRGRLYLVKHYPGLVLSDDPADVVFGELYRLRARDELLREFDMYEACGEGFPRADRICAADAADHARRRSRERGLDLPLQLAGRSICRASVRDGFWRRRAPHPSFRGARHARTTGAIAPLESSRENLQMDSGLALARRPGMTAGACE